MSLIDGGAWSLYWWELVGTLNVCYFDWSCICVNSCLVWTAGVFHFLWGLEFFISKWGWWEPSGLACMRFWGAYCLSVLSCCQNCQCIEFSDLSLASNYFIFTLTFILIYSCFHAHIWSFIPSFILIHSGFGFFHLELWFTSLSALFAFRSIPLCIHFCLLCLLDTRLDGSNFW